MRLYVLKYLLFLLGIFIALALVSAIIHEYAHVLLGEIFGLNPTGPYWSDLKYLAPSVRFNVVVWSWQLQLTHYAGGLVTGSILIVLYYTLASRRLFTVNRYFWGLGLWISMFAIYHFGQGFLEGMFHEAYIIRGSSIQLVQAIFGLLGAVLHVFYTWDYSVLLLQSKEG